MASTPNPHQIRRVPVPVRRGPATTTTVSTEPSPQVITHTESSSLIQPPTSLSLPVTRDPIIVVRDQHHHRPRGPIPLVATNSHQSIPAHASHGHNYSHNPQHPHQYSLHAIDMESDSRMSTLPSNVEKDIKAAVSASMRPTKPVIHGRGRSVPYKKALRWMSISLSIVLVVAEPVLSHGRDTTVDALGAYVLCPLLIFWNSWRLLRLRKSHDVESISLLHLSVESLLLFLAISLTVWSTFETLSMVAGRRIGRLDFATWKGIAAAIIFFFLIVFHTILFIITIVERCTKPRAGEEPGFADAQQLPPIIVQYISSCQHCHAPVEPQRGEDRNSYLARTGDTQPQGVAPAYFSPHKES